MKKNQVKVGETYRCKVSGSVVDVRITGENAHGGWDAVNTLTNRKVRVKSAQRLRGKSPARPAKREKVRSLAEADAKNTGDAKPSGGKKKRIVTREQYEAEAGTGSKPARKRDTGEPGATGGEPGGKPMSLLDSAAHLLSLGTGDAMRCKDIVDLAVERGLWAPRTGKTPANTLYAAISREIKTKGDDSRFVKVERGKFKLNR